MGLLRNFTERQDMADFLYYAYQGLLFRRRRIPKAVKDFDMLAEIAMELMPLKKSSSKRVVTLCAAVIHESLHGAEGATVRLNR